MKHEAAAFKLFEHRGWQQSVEQYHSSFGKITALTVPHLLAALDSDASPRSLLDVACGPGYLAAAAARRGWKAEGVDFSEEMVAKARTLFPEAGFSLGDAEKLAFEENRFNAVALNFGLLHLAQPEAAIHEAFRVAAPGGRFAFTVWAPPEEALGFSIVLKAIQSFGRTDPGLPPGPPFFKYSSETEAADALSAAGFESFASERISLIWHLSSGEELFDAFYKGTARTGGLLRAQHSNDLVRIREAVIAESESFRSGDLLQIPMPALLYSCRKRA